MAITAWGRPRRGGPPVPRPPAPRQPRDPRAAPAQGPPPFRRLARAFNTMTERLANHDRQRRDLMADLSHELRTPVTVLQGKLEGLLDGVYPRDDDQLTALLEETGVLSRLIDDLRTLALSESGALQ